ncbi:MAG TPA: tetratricopeptide repeat protein [Polyangiales bacterium]|nr:tetratricopeptide repeat protein [Polyangiales bacterium]
MRLSMLCLCLLVGCAHVAQKPERDRQPRPPVHVDLAARARQLLAAGDHVRAEQYYAAAIDAGGELDTLLPALLRVCVAAERYEAALAYTERYQPSTRDNPRLELVLAALQLGLGQVERARKTLEALLEDREDAQAHYLLAQLYYHSLSDFGSADRHYREYLALAPNGKHAAEARHSLLKEAQP